tara:strand:+ start:164 stop:385 length:222 start_codon:yes stop_codon:yes gene_type:complete
MTLSLGMIVGLVGMLGIGLFWAVRTGKKMQRLENFEIGQDKLRDVSRFNRKVDAETDKKINSSDGPVSGPWLR